MPLSLKRRALLVSALALLSIIVSPAHSFAQEGSSDAQTAQAAARAKSEVDLEMQLHLLIGTNKQADSSKIPPALEPAMRQLRSTMQFTSYRFGGAFLNRVKSGRSLDVRGTAGALPLLLSSPNANTNPYTPVFYEFSMRPVELKTDASGREVVSINGFNFGMRVPVVTSLATGSSGGGNAAVQYENIGINTGLSIGVGQPVVVGTLYTGQEGDVIIVVLTANRVTQR